MNYMSAEISSAALPTQRDRVAMNNGNALNIGLFGANCSSGRAVTTVPERWSGSWRTNLVACLAPTSPWHPLMPPVGSLEVPAKVMLDLHGFRLKPPLTWACGLLAFDSNDPHHCLGTGVGLQPLASIRLGRRQAIRDRRSYWSRALWPEHRRRLERGRVPDVRRHAARARGALRLCAGMARRGKSRLGSAG